MRVVGIVASPHNEWGSTGKLVTAALQQAKELGAETEFVPLAEKKINFCVSARQCHAIGKCIYDDDVGPIQDKMAAADGIILSSPVYCGQLAGQMKTLMDRISGFFHCHTLEGKYGAAVAVAANTDADRVAEYLNYFLGRCGAQTVSSLALLGRDGKFADEAACLGQARQLGSQLVAAIQEKREFPEQIREILNHRESAINLVLRRKADFAYEFNCLKEKGWV